MESSLSRLFSSAARTAVLETLYPQSAPIPLRHVAYLSEAPLFSVQRALAQLTREKLVKRSMKRHRTLFILNTKHPDYDILSRVFRAATNATLERRSKTYAAHARRALEFANSAVEFSKKVGTRESH
jgi:hypothetical protein